MRIRGDSFFSWYEDMAGRTVVRDRKSYVYAQLDERGWLSPTGLVVGRDDPEAAGVRTGVFPKPEAVRAFRQQELARRVAGSGVQGAAATNAAPPSMIAPVGAIKNLVVLCQFSDHDSTKTRAREDYDVVFNTIGGDPTLAPTGSVKDYFTETSYGTVTLNSTVVAWVTLPNTEAYYANGQHGTGSYPTNAQRMVYDALNLADPLVNFGDFDADNNGFIDAITIIHSGYAAETGGGAGNWIWSHKWSLWAVPGGSWTSADVNGSGANVKVYDYHTEAALWGTSGTGITRIGVICHETGHFFGLPDLYDTDQTSEGIGSYCLMANSWGFDFTQQHPPHFSAWCKQQLGWVTPTVITNGTYNAPRVAQTPTLFRINAGYPSGEYLLIENRQPFGFESNMPQGGLCIWHIDETKTNNNAEGYPGQAGWPSNGNHYKIALLQADGLYEMEKGMNRGNGGDVYHGGGVSQITPGTVPNTDRYQGGTVMASNNFITSIGAAGASMAFTYQQVALPSINSALAVNAPINAAFSYQITATNSPTNFAATNLPAGLSLNTSSGLISGTPTTMGVYNVALSATNVEGTGNATLVLTLTPPVLMSFNLDTDPGWTRQGEWDYGTPTGGGGTSHGRPDPTAGATGTKVFGINLNGDYSTAVGGPFYLTTTALNLATASGTQLRFKRWLNADFQPYVYATVQVSNNGTSWTTVWLNSSVTYTDDAWAEVSCDISAVADGQSTVYVRWGHQVGSSAWAYSGWNLDDVQILGTLVKNVLVSLPAEIIEGAAAGSGTVTLSEAPASDLAVTLTSAQPARLLVPASVMVLAGQTQAVFPVSVVNDSVLNGSPLVAVTAATSGYVGGSATMRVVDDETTVLSVLLPSSAKEGTAGLTGTVATAQPVGANVQVTLISGDEGELQVPESVTILSGQTQAVFPLTVVNDGLMDGNQTVTVTAEVSGWMSGQASMVIQDAGAVDYYTESFAGGGDSNDTLGRRFIFTPDGDHYSVTQTSIAAFATSPSGGTTINLGDDSFGAVSLSGGAQVSLYGMSYGTLYVGSNGYITLGEGSDEFEQSFENHFVLPRISALLNDLNPSAAGTVSWRQVTDRVAVTWDGVPNYGTSQFNRFQIEMYFDGRIAISILQLGSSTGLIGLSEGLGVPADFVESDFSSYAQVNQLSLNVPEAVTEGDGVVAASVSVSPVPAADLTVSLQASSATGFSLPASVIVPAGQTSANFNLTVIDDALLDGTETVQVTVSAAGYLPDQKAVKVHDNETAVISLNMPSTAEEGQVGLSGLLTLSAAPGSNVAVSLSSDVPNLLGLPATVIVPAGQISQAFTFSIPDNNRIEGPVVAQVTAAVTNWTSGQVSVTVQDNDALTLSVNAPDVVMEGQYLAGSLSISGVLSEDLEINLTSSQSGRLEVSETVLIEAGQTQADFDLIASENNTPSDSLTVTLTATAAGADTVMKSVQVRDATFDQLTVSTIASPQQVGVPFGVQVSARNPQGELILNFDSEIDTQLTADGSYVNHYIVNLSDGLFVNGVLSFNLVVYDIVEDVLLSVSALGKSGQSNLFDVIHGPLDHFTLSEIYGAQTQAEPFPVTISARDLGENIVPTFTEVSRLRALVRKPDGSFPNVRIYSAYADELYLEGLANKIINAVPVFDLYGVGETNPTALAAELAGVDVLIIPEQSLATTSMLAALGTSLSSVLTNFVNAGGKLIVCSQTGDEHLIPVNAGLLTAAKGATFANATLNRVQDHFLGSATGSSLAVTNVTTFSTGNGAILMREANTSGAVVIHRDVGQGRVVLIGSNLSGGKTPLDRVLYNAVQWDREALISPTTTTAFVDGTWSGDVQILEAPVLVTMRAEFDQKFGDSVSFMVDPVVGVPLIAVEQPAGTPLQSGFSEVNYGSNVLGAAGSARVFTVKNVGEASTLEIDEVSVSGVNATDFVVSRTGLVTSLEGGQSTTFTVTFSPRGVGERMADLILTSDSSVNPVFTVSLVGQGLPVAGPAQQIIVEDVAPRKVSDGPFTVAAFATSGQALTYTVAAGPVTVDASGLVTPTGANGAVTIKISQAGGSGYHAADAYLTFVLGTWTDFTKVVTAQNGYATYALRPDGTLWTWGYVNGTGYLGDTTSFGRVTPVQVGTATNWVDLAMGNTHGLGLCADGTLWAWGGNANGQLGDNTTTSRTAPVQIGIGRTWAAIAAGSFHSAALAVDGTLWTWGVNTNGQLGDGTTTQRLIPTQVGTATDWAFLATGGSHVVAGKSNGTLWAWGSNSSGQLGDGTTIQRTSPVQVGTGSDWQSVAAGSNYTLAQKTSGELWAWGSGASGQLGTGNTTSQSSPVRVNADTDWDQFACGSFTTVARKNDGTLWVWGANTNGQLGDGTTTNRSSPQRFATGSNWASIRSASSFTVALRDDGMVWVAGEGQGMSGLVPRALSLAATTGQSFVSLSGNGDHYMTVKADGTLWGWGYGGRGMFGNGSTADRYVLTQIGTENQWAQVSAGSQYVFGNSTMAVKTNGTLWGTGTNSSYNLGNGSTTQVNTFTQIGTATNWKQVSCGQGHGLGVRTDGTLWGWGTNVNGRLGDGATTTRTTPVQIGTDTNWSFVTCGYSHTLAIKTNGTLWAWGFNGSGQLGQGDTTQRLSPVQVGTATNWVDVAAGGHTLAIKSDGTLWSWGFNSSGELGLGDTATRLSPTQVGSATNWARVSVSRSSSAALRIDGTLWTAGENHSGQVGDGSVVNRLAFTQVGTAGGYQHAVVGAQSLAAIDAEGTIWTAGAAGARVLAAGRSRTMVSPIQPSLVSQTIVPSQVSYSAWQTPVRFTGSSGLPAQVRVVSGPAVVVNGGVVPTGAGLVEVIVWQPGDERAWNAAPPQRFAFNLSNTLTAAFNTPGDVALTVDGFNADAVQIDLSLGFAPSLGQSLTLVSNTGVFPIGGQFANLPQGSYLILSFNGVPYAFRINYQGGDGNDITLTHEVAPQVITFRNVNPKMTTDVPFALEASSSSTLPVSYEVITGPASINGSTLTLTGQAGAVTLKATQAGNGQFAAAVPVIQSFVVTTTAFRFAKTFVSRFGYHALALMADGSAWNWGLNASGQLGNAGTVTRYTPGILSGTDWADFSAGYAHTLGIKTNGSLWAFGQGVFGQLGNGTTVGQLTPVQIGTATNWVNVSAGFYHSAGVRADGTLWTWGSGGSGQLGDGTTTQRNAPAQVGIETNWAAVSCGYFHTLALKTDGTLWAWGYNSSGQIGNGSTIQVLFPARVGVTSDWAVFSAGAYHSMAIKQDGSLWAWGLNSTGQLGDGTTASKTSPVRVGSSNDWNQVDAGVNSTVARRSDGSAWGWGNNTEAQLAQGDLLQYNEPRQIKPDTDWQTVHAFSSGGVGLKNDGTIVVWGDGSGYLGKSVRTLTQADGPSNWTDMSQYNAHVLLKRADGSLWRFGLNGSGQLGNGLQINQDLGQIGSQTDWLLAVAGGIHSLAIKTNGTLWGWGSNTSSQLGDGTTNQRLNPTLIDANTDWSRLSAASSHSLGLRTNGSLWAWGLNSFGQLGDATTTTRSSPTQVGSENDWSQVYAGGNHSLALKNNGSLWAWGLNSSGQLGLGDTTNRMVPARIGTDSDWNMVATNGSTSAAIKSDGSLWMWGVNSSGQLGLGDVTSRNLPTRVGTDADWAQVSLGGSFTAAVKTDGSLWVWGNNSTGQLGESSGGASVFQPRRLTNISGWVRVAAGNVSLVAMQSDGSLWTCGFNGALRLTSQSGRSQFAVAPVLPSLVSQVLTPLAPGALSGRVTASSGLPVSLRLIEGSATIDGDHITHTGPVGSTVRFYAWQKGDETAWDAALPVEMSMTRPYGDIQVFDGGVEDTELANGVSVVDYGSTVIGSGVVRTFTIHNDGEGVLTLGIISPIGDWSVNTTGMSSSLAPGATTTFTATFTPTAAGTRQGGVLIASDDPDASSFTLLFSGFGQMSQTLTFGTIPQQQCGTPLSLAGLATASSGLPVSFEITTGTAFASLNAGVITFTGTGQVTVRASQAGNAAYVAAASVERSFTVVKGDQTLTFAGATPESASYRASVLLSATSSRGLTPVLFSIVSGPGSLSGNTLTFTAPGTVLVQAAQAGDDCFNAASTQVSILASNTAPVVVNAVAAGDEDHSINGTLTGLDADSDALSFSRVANALHGSVTVNANGAFTYVPNLNFNGTDSFSYRANDGLADSNTATITLTVNPVNDAPETFFLNAQTLEDETLNGTLEGADVDGDPLTFALVANAAHGAVTVNAAGTYIYVPDADFYGEDSFTYKTNDGLLDSGLSQMTITVLGINDAPVVAAASISGDEDTTLQGQLTGQDVEDDPLSFALVAQAAHGLVTVNADGSFSYVPNLNFNGTDSFTYKANDQQRDSNVATVSITVDAVNDAPTVVRFSQVTNEDTTLNLAVAGSDVENDSLTFSLVSNAAHGTVTLNPNGSYAYAPAPDFNGEDSFTYKANDGQADSAAGTVEITVQSVNDAPVAEAQSLSTADSVSLAIVLTGSDVEEDPLSFVLVSQPTNGNLTGTAPNLSYLSNPGYAGPDSFTFKVNDGELDSETVTVSITVNPVAPVITVPPVAQTSNPGERVVLSVTNTGSQPLTYRWLKDGEEVAGAEASSLVLDPLTEAQQGHYQVRISNIVDTVTSASVLVDVNDPIVFTSQPLSREVSETDEVIFSVEVTGTGPIRYQWKKDGTDIPDATSSSYRIDSAAKAAEGEYSVVVSNVVGDYPSQIATLAVVEGLPKIIQLTSHQMLRPGQHLRLEVSALGRPPLTYQWFFNGKKITGATQRKLALYSVGLTQAGRYSVTVKSAEITPSTDVQVGVVTDKPAPLVLAPKGTATMKVSAAGNQLTFIWRRVDGDMPVPPRMVLSKDLRTLTLKTLTTDDAGRYYCEVTGPGGSLSGATTDLSIFDTAPDLLTQNLPDGMVGDLYTHSVKLGGTSRHAVTKFSASGLPKGVSINAKTGLISGRPTVAKKYNVTITASNAKGSPSVTEEIEIKAFPLRLAGSYTGIIPRHLGLNDDLGGRVDFTISSLGSISGKMILGARSLTLKGSVDLDPDEVDLPKVEITLLRPVKGAPALHPVTLSAIIDTAADKRHFTTASRLHADADEVGVSGWSLPWNKLLNAATAHAAFYTLALELPADLQDVTGIPQGNGFAAFTLGADGKTKVAGKTADGTSFTCSTHLSQTADLGMFAVLYGSKPMPGSLIGKFRLVENELPVATDNTVSGQWTWSRPDRRPKGGNTYPAGFTPIPLDLLGGVYTKPAFHLDVTPGVDVPHLYFAAAGIEASETQPDTSLSIDSKNVIKIAPAKAGIVTLKSDSAKASFNGTLKLSDPHWSKPAPARWPREVGYQGIIVRLPEGYRGFGYFLLPAIPVVDPKITAPQNHSGQVIWVPNPLLDD